MVYNCKAKNCSTQGLSLNQLSEPFIKVNKRKFKNETVEMDFCEFTKCSFKNCVLQIKYGNFKLYDCIIDSCSLSMEYPALMVAIFLKAYFKDKPIEINNLGSIVSGLNYS